MINHNENEDENEKKDYKDTTQIVLNLDVNIVYDTACMY